MPHQCTTCGNLFDDGSKEMLGGCPECGGNTFQFHPGGADVPAEPPDEDPPEPEGSTAANTVGRAATKVRDLVSGDTSEPPESGPKRDPEPAGEPEPKRDPGPAGETHPEPEPEPGPEPEREPGSGQASRGADTPDPNASWPGEEAPDEFPSVEGDSDIIDADAREAARTAPAGEDGAQSAARGELADDADIPAGTEGGLAGAEADVGAADAGGTDADDGPSAGDAPSGGRVVSEPSEDQPDLGELREQLNDQFESIKILEPGQYELNLMELYDREEYIIALQENGRYVIQVPEQWLGDQPGA